MTGGMIVTKTWIDKAKAMQALLRLTALACGLVLLPAAAQAAEPLPAPQGEVILTVSGNIAVTNTDGGAAFDRAMLEELGLTELSTTTNWTDGVQVFAGVLGRTVLERVGAQGEVVMASALNDYTVEVPMTDFMNHDVLLAMDMNGEAMQVSDKGPIWIVYPRDQVPELQDRKLHERWVWQLKALQVQ
jgi:hypothetical protein